MKTTCIDPAGTAAPLAVMRPLIVPVAADAIWVALTMKMLAATNAMIERRFQNDERIFPRLSIHN
jgi:hypothetical protein